MSEYEFINIKKEGHLLIVEFNRPEVYNALHNPAHKELHEIWEDYANDSDLWVAILTGQETRHFVREML